MALTPFVIVRETTGTPGGVADTAFSLAETLAMMRTARLLVRASRQGDQGAQAQILDAFRLASTRGNRDQPRAVLVAHLVREAVAEDEMFVQGQAAQAEMQHEALRGRARDTSMYEPQAAVGGVNGAPSREEIRAAQAALRAQRQADERVPAARKAAPPQPRAQVARQGPSEASLYREQKLAEMAAQGGAAQPSPEAPQSPPAPQQGGG